MRTIIRLALAFAVILMFGLGGCQVFEELHYVYVLPNTSLVPGAENLPEPRKLDADHTSGSEMDHSHLPAIISDGSGSSLRFYLRSPEQGKSGQPSIELFATIVDATMARNLYRNSRGQGEAGRMPDLMLLEIRVKNSSSSTISVNPYSTVIECDGKIREPLEPELYLEQYAGLSHIWLSYAWHMIPTRSPFFFRQDPGSFELRDEYLLSAMEKESLRKQELDFLQELRKAITLDPGSDMILFLPFHSLPINSNCELSFRLQGLPARSFSFEKKRISHEQWKSLKESPEWESHRSRYLSERQSFFEQLGEEEERLQSSHINRRKEFCQDIPEESELQSKLRFCNDSFWFRWSGSGFE